MLDLSRLWATCDVFGVQRAAPGAPLYTWTRMHGTHLELVDPHVPLCAFSGRASLFLERATNDKEHVFEMFFEKRTAS